MNINETIDECRGAFSDPDAPWYGSDVVPWVADLCDEIERLQGIVGKLPKTADQVSVVPGMDIWIDDADGPRQVLVVSINESDIGQVTFHGTAEELCFSRHGYSTRQAAEERARAEIEKKTPPNEQLLRLAEQYPPPQEWYDEHDIERLNDPRFDGPLNREAANEIERLQIWESLALELWRKATPDPDGEIGRKAVVDFLAAAEEQLGRELDQFVVDQSVIG